MTALFIFIGVVGGAVSGLMGIGAGLVMAPLLVLLAGFSQKAAQGTTLAMLVLPVAAFSAVAYFRAGYVNVKAALLMAAGFAVAALLTAHYTVKLPEQTVARIFGGFLVVVAAKLLFFTK